MSFHVEHVLEVDALGPGTNDADVWQFAVQEELLVFTNDADFVDGTVAPSERSHPGIIRYVGIDWTAIYRATCRIDRYLSMDELVGHTFRVPGNWI